jgi:hypothetical protein
MNPFLASKKPPACHSASWLQGPACRLHAIHLGAQRVVELPHIALGAGLFLCHMICCRNASYQCVLEVANPLIRVEAAVSHLDTISLSFFFSSQKQATVLASSTSQCLTPSKDVMQHILFGFKYFSRSSVSLSGVKRFKPFLSLVLVFVSLCVCVSV